MRTALIAAALCCLGSAAAAQVGKRPASLTACRAGETQVFACRAGAKTAAVCAAPDKTTYRYGPLGRPEIEVASNGRDSRAYRSTVTGQGGGRQDTVRFRKGAYSYLVSDGVQGRLSERPGKAWSVVTVMKGHAQIASLPCQAIGRRGGLADVKLPEETDQAFVGWW